MLFKLPCLPALAAANNIDIVLNNSVWHALNTGNQHLAQGNHNAKYFDSEVSPFVAFADNTRENFTELYRMLAGNRLCFLASPVKVDIPAPWNIIACVRGLQLVHSGILLTEEPIHNTNILLPQHSAEMVNLAKLTNPGPFGMRTIDFGHYQGVFDDNKLVAMAGQRMHAYNCAEISAVCTHPDHTGKGYARQLLTNQINRIITASDIPYLHVKHDNKRAVDLYQSLGFTVRCNMYFYIFNK